MKLTKKEKQIAINRWQTRYDYPLEPTKWEPESCPLCKKFLCEECPVVLKTKHDCRKYKSLYKYWYRAKTEKTLKKYANKLLEIMKQL